MLHRSWQVIACWAVLITTAIASDTPPNVLWISCEDISPHLGCYGDPHAITPNLDTLASEGVRYTHAFTAAGVCAPNRSSIITGMYQNSIGTHHMRCNAVLPKWLKPFPMLMKQAGYYCTNNSKTDYQFREPSARTIWNESGGRAHWKNRTKDEPFFAVFNFTGCHESGIASEGKYRSVTKDLTTAERQDSAELTTLPPYYPDTPVTREDWKRNYELITAMDAWAGGLIDELKEAGLYENTIIFFWSDHGVGLPRAKRWLYDSGTRIPLIVRIPKSLRDDDQGKPNTVDDRLVCSVDFAPTVLNLAGVPIPNKLQGQPFLGTKLPPKRKYVFGARDRMDERYDIIRTVRDQRFRYVRNFEPLKPYYQYMNTPEKGATMIEIRRAEQSGNLTETMAVFSAATKPAEELYDLENDFHEVNNLADNPEHAGKLAEMRTALKDWQNEIGDVGLIPEAEIEIEEKQAGSRYDILHDRPDSAQLLERLVTIATQASSGPDQLDDLIAGLQDENASVRYWSATGIGNIGPDVATAQAANQTRTAIKRCLTDTSPSVRIAAARAIARLGNPTAAIKILQQELVSDHQWGRLAAAIVLDEMDDEAKPATDALQGALKDQPNKYIVRVANRALNEMQGTNNQVP
ncbi:MAG: sulfatase-like hydrolase/transferase [Planctomycetaceae bacterium]|nr:sulfatase-like hydrolase/transferase [Planctomycetaceae bacterium]